MIFFLKQFLNIYEKCFPIKEIQIKKKNLLSPWITRGIIKSSKRKQKLYIKFLKNKSYANEERYKQYKRLLKKSKIILKNYILADYCYNIITMQKKLGIQLKLQLAKRKLKSITFHERYQ